MKQGQFTQFLRRHRYAIALGAILVLAAYMRFHELASLPPGLHPDEAANGLDILSILEKHNIQPFYPSNGGREGLFFLLQSIAVGVIGNTTYALRVTPAALSTIAVGVMYLWASSWFGKRTGLLAAFLLAVTPWAVIISRDCFRASMLMLMIPLILWLYTKALQTGSRWWYLAAGGALGAGFYTYLAYRLFPLAILAALVFVYIWKRDWLKQRVAGLVLSVVAAVAVLVPMILYGLRNPADLFARSGGVSVTNPALNHGHLLQTLALTIAKTAIMFNISGDQNYRQNFGGQPELNIFVGIMFLLGIFMALRRWRSLRYSGVLIVFAVMLLPEVLTAEGIPHALRSIGALPECILLAAVGITYMIESWWAVFPLNRAARAGGAVAVIVLLALTAYQGYVEYFVAWANAPQTYEAYSEDTSSLASYYLKTAFTGQRYAIGGGYGLMPLQYLAHNHVTYTQVDPGKVSSIQIDHHSANEFSMAEGDKVSGLKTLEARFPDGKISPHYSTFSGHELFVTYTIPAS